MMYLLIKSLHIIFITSWFAGLFYLPRIFVNQAMVNDPATQKQLNLMARKLYRFMTPLGVLAIIFGLWLWLGYGLKGGWLHAKTTLALGLVAYHLYCGKLVALFEQGRNTRSHRWYRVFNEIPVLVLFACVILVIFKPF